MEQQLRIIAAQINPTVGDVTGNTAKVIAFAKQARDELKADIVVFPEMVITGYPPEDLLLRPELYTRVKQALSFIMQQVNDIHMIIGYPTLALAPKSSAAKAAKSKSKYAHYNAASVIHNGSIVATYFKQQLPNYGVFDEKRYFVSGSKPCTFKIKSINIALTICEDLWFPETMQQAKEAGAELMISINSSPFDINKPLLRENIMGKRAREGKMPLIYVNCVGGQDELVFDGGSMALNASGTIAARATFFNEMLLPIDVEIKHKTASKFKEGSTAAKTERRIVILPQPTLPISSIEERVYQALVLGVRDYINKNHFCGVIVSVSGGIDSALTLAIACDALGKERVHNIYMPSRYNAPLSLELVKTQAKILEVPLSIISIDPIFESFLKQLHDEFGNLPPDVTEENIQARCRAVMLMAISNKKKLIVLSTGNKSEMSVGYATLYGDMVGGFCVLKDTPKTMVYRLARYRNNISPVIPQEAIDRPPSAELAPNQKDTDSLPPYPILDEILERYIENDQSKDEIIAAGFDEKTVTRVIRLVNGNEYKRRQAPPGVRITARAFGRDRRYPITSGF